MNSEYSLYWTREDLICFNLVRGRTPEEVLRDYGVDPDVALTLTRTEADEEFGSIPDTGSVLRAGAAGSWSFCLETWNPVGFAPQVLGRLSSGTDAVHCFRNPKGGFFVKHLRDERIVDNFELDDPESSPSQEAPLRLAEKYRSRASGRASGDQGYDEIWAVLGDLVGVPLNDDLIQGPLPTVLRPDPS